MKDLAKDIKRGGFDYSQVFNGPKGYVYSQTAKGRLIGFEAFLRKENTQFNCISFPGDNAFGIWAWSTRTLEKALKYVE